MAILSSGWMFDEKIDALGKDHLAVRCFLAAVSEANPDGTLGPATPAWVRMRLLPCGVSNEEAWAAWEAVERAGLIATWEEDGRTWAILPGWWNHASSKQRVMRAAKSPPVPAALLSVHRKFAVSYLKCDAGRNAQRAETSYGDFPGKSGEVPGSPRTPGDSRGIPGPSSSSSQSLFTSQQASKHCPPPPGNGARWPAAWDAGDQEGRVSQQDRERFERAWSAAGEKPLTEEAAGKVAEAFTLSAMIASAKLRAMLESPESKDNPARYLLASTKLAIRDATVKASASAAARTDRRTAEPVDQAAVHRLSWSAGGRPKTWKTCACSACVKGREEPASASGDAGDAEAVHAGERARAATG